MLFFKLICQKKIMPSVIFVCLFVGRLTFWLFADCFVDGSAQLYLMPEIKFTAVQLSTAVEENYWWRPKGQTRWIFCDFYQLSSFRNAQCSSKFNLFINFIKSKVKYKFSGRHSQFLNNSSILLDRNILCFWIEEVDFCFSENANFQVVWHSNIEFVNLGELLE